MLNTRTLPKDLKELKYYDIHGVLKEIVEAPAEMSLETELRKDILSGKGKGN